MPSAPKFDAPQGDPLHEVEFRAITEALAGNGVLANGDLEVTDGTNAMEIDVAAGTVFYVATEYSYGGASPAATLTQGDGTYDRWDTVAFDTGTGSVVVHEGTAEQYPTAPDISGGELLLATVYVPSGATDIGSSNIRNWRAKFSNEAEEVHYDDSTGDYGVSNVDAALDAIDLDFVRGRDNTITGSLAGLGTNPGAFGSVVDMVVDSNSAAGTEHSYHYAVDGEELLTISAESDGAGGIQNREVRTGVFTSGAGTYRPVLQVQKTETPDGGTTFNDYIGRLAISGSPRIALTAQHVTNDTIPAGIWLDPEGDETAFRGDLADVDSGALLWDTNNQHIPQGSVEGWVTTTVTANYTPGNYENVLGDASGGAITVTLPGPSTGVMVTVKKIDSSTNAVTVATPGTETIDGDSERALDGQYNSLTITSDGTNYFIV